MSCTTGRPEVPDRQRPHQSIHWDIPKTCRHSGCRAYRYKAVLCSVSGETSPNVVPKNLC
eukprot:129867-Amphidinium_carterae.1